MKYNENYMPRKLSTKEILEENLAHNPPGKMREVKVLLHDIRSLHNVGSVFRSSDAFGISKILMSGFTPRPPRPEITKTAIGAEEFVDWKDVQNPIIEISKLKHNGYTIVGLEQTDKSIFLPDFDANSYDKLCLVMGNEVSGIDEALLTLIDIFVSIPQFGQKHSLNVSVATGVVLYALLEKFWEKKN